jgi:hypothetical protein
VFSIVLLCTYVQVRELELYLMMKIKFCTFSCFFVSIYLFLLISGFLNCFIFYLSLYFLTSFELCIFCGTKNCNLISVLFIYRMSLDDNHNSVVLACAKVIQCILSCDVNENFFEISEVEDFLFFFSLWLCFFSL